MFGKKRKAAIEYCKANGVTFACIGFSALDRWVLVQAKTPYGFLEKKLKYLSSEQMMSIVLGKVLTLEELKQAGGLPGLKLRKEGSEIPWYQAPRY